MTPKAATLLKVLLNRYHKALSRLPSAISPIMKGRRFKKNPTESGDLHVALAGAEELVKMVHYSWLKPFLVSQPQNLIPLFLSALPKETSFKLAKNLQISPAGTLTEPLKIFLLQQIKNSVIDPKVLLPPYLPDSPLNKIAYLSKAELLTLIDYFGLYDLAESIRQIVDKRVIKQIYSCLTPRKQENFYVGPLSEGEADFNPYQSESVEG